MKIHRVTVEVDGKTTWWFEGPAEGPIDALQRGLWQHAAEAQGRAGLKGAKIGRTEQGGKR